MNGLINCFIVNDSRPWSSFSSFPVANSINDFILIGLNEKIRTYEKFEVMQFEKKIAKLINIQEHSKNRIELLVVCINFSCWHFDIAN